MRIVDPPGCDEPWGEVVGAAGDGRSGPVPRDDSVRGLRGAGGRGAETFGGLHESAWEAATREQILLPRGQRVRLDSHLATLDAVEVRALLQAVLRNAERFAADFMFRLAREEQAASRSRHVHETVVQQAVRRA
jgi:ORF6N domain